MSQASCILIRCYGGDSGDSGDNGNGCFGRHTCNPVKKLVELKNKNGKDSQIFLPEARDM